MAESYDYHSALKRRLDAIQEYGNAQSTWEILRAQKLREKRAADEANMMGQAAANRQSWNPQAGGAPASTGNASFDRFLAAISGQESGGNYSARNRSSGAMGKYQIMPANLGGTRSGWDYETLGYDVTPAQFMSSPDIQERIAQAKLKQYFDAYGPAGAAIAWYAGPGSVRKYVNAGSGDIARYRNSILRRMGG